MSPNLPNYVNIGSGLSQSWLKQWLGVWWHQAITRTYVESDVCRYMVPLDHNELTVSLFNYSPRH